MTKLNCKIPTQGETAEDVLEELRSLRHNDIDFKGSRAWSLVYYLGEEHERFLKDAFEIYFSENALNPLAFQSLKRMESEVIRMTANLLNGNEEVCGAMTSGGTETCMLAVKTYRDRAKKLNPFLRKPEIIVPESIHVAFDKAAEYFGVKIARIPLDKNYRVRTDLVRRKINRKTICIIASAPCYPFGTIDPIVELGKIAQEKNIPLHVDACLGGFILPFMEKINLKLRPFDFRVPGVTSIGADVHKYGYAAKGASVILYRNMSYFEHQFFITENWPGGIFASPTMLGTRPGGAFAAAWAVLKYMGEEGYIKKTKIIMDTVVKLKSGINSIPGLRIIGDPEASVFAFQSVDTNLNIYAVGDRMEERGWHIDRQQRPESLHSIVMPTHAKVADQYLNDLNESVQEVRDKPEYAFQGEAAMYGMISRVPMRGMIRKKVLEMMKDLYGPQMKLPELSRKNRVNTVEVKEKGVKEKIMDWGERIWCRLCRLRSSAVGVSVTRQRVGATRRRKLSISPTARSKCSP